MKNWERHQQRIANAKSETEFMCRIFDLELDLNRICSLQRKSDECNSRCGECKTEWLNREAEDDD